MELGATRTVLTNCVGVVVALVLVEGPEGVLCGTARLSLCLFGYEADFPCLLAGRGGCDAEVGVEAGVAARVVVEGDDVRDDGGLSDKGEGMFYLHGRWRCVVLKKRLNKQLNYLVLELHEPSNEGM